MTTSHAALVPRTVTAAAVKPPRAAVVRPYCRISDSGMAVAEGRVRASQTMASKGRIANPAASHAPIFRADGPAGLT